MRSAEEKEEEDDEKEDGQKAERGDMEDMLDRTKGQGGEVENPKSSPSSGPFFLKESFSLVGMTLGPRCSVEDVTEESPVEPPS